MATAPKSLEIGSQVGTRCLSVNHRSPMCALFIYIRYRRASWTEHSTMRVSVLKSDVTHLN